MAQVTARPSVCPPAPPRPAPPSPAQPRPAQPRPAGARLQMAGLGMNTIAIARVRLGGAKPKGRNDRLAFTVAYPSFFCASASVRRKRYNNFPQFLKTNNISHGLYY